MQEQEKKKEPCKGLHSNTTCATIYAYSFPLLSLFHLILFFCSYPAPYLSSGLLPTALFTVVAHRSSRLACNKSHLCPSYQRVLRQLTCSCKCSDQALIRFWYGLLWAVWCDPSRNTASRITYFRAIFRHPWREKRNHIFPRESYPSRVVICSSIIALKLFIANRSGTYEQKVMPDTSLEVIGVILRSKKSEQNSRYKQTASSLQNTVIHRAHYRLRSTSQLPDQVLKG